MMEFSQGDLIQVSGFKNLFLIVSKNAFIRAVHMFHVCPVLKNVAEGPLHIPIKGINEYSGTVICEQLKLIDILCEKEHEALEKEGAPVYEGMGQVLKELSGRFPLFIVSNCQAGYIELVMEKTGFGSLISDHLCPGITGQAKAENIMALVKKHHLSSPVYVGDTKGDFEACQKAGVPFIFASYGYGTVQNPDYTIKKPADLLTICR